LTNPFRYMEIPRAEKRIVAGVALALLAAVTAGSQQSGVRELAPGVFFWQGDHVLRKPANCTWVVFKDFVLVIDSNFPWAAREILAEIRRTTAKPVRFVFNTHYHGDHTFGNSIFVDEGASVVSSRECAADLKVRGQAAWSNWRQTPERSLTGSRLEYAALTFADKMVFDDGVHRVELIRVGPAHTKGDAVAYLPKEKILATGDLCVNWTWGNNFGDPDADFEGWIRVLDELARWDVQIVAPGHGGLGTTETLRGQKEYLADMLTKVRTGVRAGKTADQLATETDLSKHGSFGSDQHAPGMSNANAIRAIYRKMSSSER
jgi:cyclase